MAHPVFCGNLYISCFVLLTSCIARQTHMRPVATDVAHFVVSVSECVSIPVSLAKMAELTEMPFGDGRLACVEETTYRVDGVHISATW